MPPKDGLSIGERIKRRRESLGLTQDDVARLVGYKSRSSINKLELSRDIPSNKIEKLASALATTPGYLMGWTDNPSVSTSEYVASTGNTRFSSDNVVLDIGDSESEDPKVSIFNLTKPKFSDLKTLVGRGKSSLTPEEKMELVKELLSDEDLTNND